jgi:hypothetical protein
LIYKRVGEADGTNGSAHDDVLNMLM